jgi:hypothetical protein
MYVHVTINTPTLEYEHEYDTDSLDEIVRDVVARWPQCTSIVMAVVLESNHEQK